MYGKKPRHMIKCFKCGVPYMEGEYPEHIRASKSRLHAIDRPIYVPYKGPRVKVGSHTL